MDVCTWQNVEAAVVSARLEGVCCQKKMMRKVKIKKKEKEKGRVLSGGSLMCHRYGWRGVFLTQLIRIHARNFALIEVSFQS